MYKFPEKIFPKALNYYLQCPFKFKSYSDSEVKAKFVETYENYIGKVIHSVLKDLFDIKKVPINKRREQNIGEMVKSAWARMPKSNFTQEFWKAKDRLMLFGSLEQERAFGMNTIAILKNYLSRADLSVIPLSLEDWMDTEINIGNNESVKIAGRIDRIDQDSSSAISVWDYKTGKLPFYHNINDIIKHDLQLPLYAVIASKLHPFAEKIRVGLIYVRYSKIYDVTWDKAYLKEIESQIASLIQRIKNDKEFIPRLNNLCNWCEYKDICPLRSEIEKKNKRDIEEVNW